METKEHIGILSRYKQCGSSYAQACEFAGSFLPLKGNKG